MNVDRHHLLLWTAWGGPLDDGLARVEQVDESLVVAQAGAIEDESDHFICFVGELVFLDVPDFLLK